MAVVVAITGLTAVSIGVFGVVIWRYQRVGLISGVDPDAVTDRAELARFVGGNLLLIAGLTLLVAVLAVVRSAGDAALWVGYTICIALLSVWTAYGTQSYTEPL
jgi:hypothetical protein